MKYRKKPIVIEAMQLPTIGEGASQELIKFLNTGTRPVFSDHAGGVAIRAIGSSRA